MIPNGDSQAARCAAWERVTGDAGWAGELLRRFCEWPDAPVHVVCKPGTPTLELFAEALALLPPDVRWRIGFSTYFTGIPAAGVKCHWRGIIAGTAAAEGAIDPKSVIDLSRPLGPAPDGPYNVAAREGRIVDLPTVRSPATPRETPITLAGTPDLSERKAGDTKPIEAGLLDLAPLEAKPRATRFFHPHKLDQSNTQPHTPRKNRWILPAVLGAVAFVIVMAIGVWFVLPHLGSMGQLGQAMLVTNISGNNKAAHSPAPVNKKPSPPVKTAAKPQAPLPKSKKPPKKQGPSGSKPLKGSQHKPSERIPSNGLPVVANSSAKIHYMLDVVNKPIFATSAAGSLLLRSARTSLQESNVTSFLVAFPPPGDNGNLLLKSTGGVGAGKWENVGSLPAHAVTLPVRWEPDAKVGSGIPTPGGRDGAALASIRVTNDGNLAVHPASKLGGPGLPYVQQMAVDVRLKNGRRERIQFLPNGPRRKIVTLTDKTPSGFLVDIPSQFANAGHTPAIGLDLKLEGGGAAGNWKRGKTAYVLTLEPATRDRNLESLAAKVHKELGEPGTPQNIRPLAPLTLRVNSQAFTNNYASLTLGLRRLARKCRRDITWAEKKLTQHKGLAAKQAEALRRYQRHPKKNKYRIEPLKREKDLHGDLVSLTRALKVRQKRIKQRRECLTGLAGTTFRIDLYPGGPVLERFTFKKGGANE